MSRRVAFLIPHERGCIDLATGETYASVAAVKENTDHIMFNIMGDVHA
jgi:hypothetical protein